MAFKAPAKTATPIKHIPPQSLEAEAAVLGSILINPDSMNKVVEILEAEHFYSPQNKLIYEAIFTLFNQNKPIDGLSLTEYFRSRNKLDDIGGVEYLGELGLDTVLSSNIEYYAEIMQLRPETVKINSAKKRYGSCSGKNNLNFSLFLMDKDERFVDYVVVHELAHIKHHNHSKDFYKFDD